MFKNMAERIKEIQTWKDDGKGKLKPVVQTCKVKEKDDCEVLTVKEERDWVPEDDNKKTDVKS